MRHSRSSWFIAAATLVAGLGGAAAASVQSTSASQSASTHLEADAAVSSQSAGATARGRSVTPVSAAASASTVAPAPVAPASPSTARTTDATPPAKDHEPLRLHCDGFGPHEGRAGIKCAWSASQDRRFTAYRLVRGDGEHRTVVFEARDRSHTAFVDHTVEPGATYHYVVQVLGPEGQVIGMSNPAKGHAAGREHVTVKLRCEPVSMERHRGVACGWSEARAVGADGYVLVRSTDGGPSQRIFHKGLEGPNRHLDTAVQGGHRYTYVVLVVDRTGDVMGRSEPVTVGWPPDKPPSPDFALR